MPHDNDDFAVAPRRDWSVWLATGGGLGFSPLMPGTVGAVWGLPLAWGVAQIPGAWWQGLAIVAVCLAGIPVCTRAARRLGGRKDPGAICLDEIASLPLTFFLIPLPASAAGLIAVAGAGFVLHRVFDIVKPPPTRRLERLPEGLGIMADDWMAGVYSHLALRGVLWSGALEHWTR